MSELNVKVAISMDFFEAFSNVPQRQQGKVRKVIEEFKNNPMSSSINYETIHKAKVKGLRSIRIDKTYRAIILKPEKGNVYILLWVDHHDKAYEWAERKQFSINPDTGSLQIYDVDTTAAVASTQEPDSYETKSLFAKYKDKELRKLGVPEDLLGVVRSIESERILEASAHKFPVEAYEALLMLAAGYSLQEVHLELEKPDVDVVVDVEDFEVALDNPDTKRRFFVVEGALELEEMLNSPLDKWRVFLHPTQRKLVSKDTNGAVRVLGGAGTGKTVVAMHRAQWLVKELYKNSNDRILFTTYTKNLASSIYENLKQICGVEELKRIEVVNLDEWVSHFLKKQGFDEKIVFDRDTRELWEDALNLAPSNLGISHSFYRDEWKQVIQGQGITSLTEYMKASRVGRGRRLNRAQRKDLFQVFIYTGS